MYELIPEELKQLKNWVVWKAVPDPKAHSGVKKIPVNPRTGGQAQSNNPETWTDFETAERVSRDYAGIGFMFEGSGYFGVDLDDMPEEMQACGDGDFDNVIGEFITTLKSYTELSQSGNGLHIICKGKLPEGKRRNGKFEMYDSGRFFVMTGNCATDEYLDIRDCTETIKPLHQKYLEKKGAWGSNALDTNEGENLFSSSCGKPYGIASPILDKIQEKTAISSHSEQLILSNDLNIHEIIEKALNSANGAKFEKLFKGDFSGYPSQSEADMAFCNLLAFWCGGDAEKMDEIYRNSGLMRDKWDRKQSGSTYGALTIQKAISHCQEFYQPSQIQIADKSLKIGKKSAPPAKALPAGKTYKFDDLGNSERLYDMYGYMLKYFYTEHKFLFYENGKWKRDDFGYAEKLTDEVIHQMEKEDSSGIFAENEEMQKAFQKHIKKTRSQNGRKNMIAGVSHFMPILPKQLDRDRTIIGMKNGVLDLKTGELKPHDSKYFLTKQIPFAYHADAPRPERWLKFLDEILLSDKELIRYIQKAVGYSLTGSNAEQCAFFLHGTGNNGKSIFLEVLRYIFGDYASNIQANTIMIQQKSGNSASSDIARLQGARLVTCSETAEGVRLNEPLIKQMTGDDMITVRKLYCEEFEFRPEFKLWMATNHKPTIRGTDKGIWRRIHLIPFQFDIPANQVDRNLKYKLAKEAESILKWIVDGCLLWQREGLQTPKKVLDAVSEYQKEMDVVSKFLDACCDVGTGEVKASALYAVYAQWCSEYGEYKMSNTKFGIEMTKKFQKVKKNGGVYYYQGISLDEEHAMTAVG